MTHHRGKQDKPKRRNPYAKMLREDPMFKQRVQQNKKAYKRHDKHKRRDDEPSD